MERLRQGVELEDGMTRPAVVTHLRDSEKYTFLEMTITEGRNRQVRRMTAAAGHPTLRLVRWGIGEWTVDGLALGHWREVVV